LDPYQPGEKSSKNGRVFGLLFEPILAPNWAPKWFQNWSKNKLKNDLFWGKFERICGPLLGSKKNQGKPRWPPKVVEESRHSDI